ncbi:MAG TPA: DUF362 domain-containing protein [Candidatus Hydrogenedentes bacterium]|nr:DUF362 domain-containing protein [Candidatus Hydrogenedentota bacterium]HOL77534.1 DUF362 domain-containing protein [Candidatus Hydrogenedentota bacterium]HPO86587.1 DUF362 domain-containing protein [Candidatus Hydrogenedentota bacterium]
MKTSKVAVLRTTPATVRADYHELLNLAGYQEYLPKDAETALKINISWHFFFPASSTTPWQLDGVIRAMQTDGYDLSRIHGCHNRTVVIDAHLGERENKQIDVIEKYGLENVHLYEGEEWIHIRDAVGDLTDKFLCLNDVYPKGFSIPKRFLGENIIHLPTVKTHVFTTTTGAMKNAFGGLLNEHRHWTHPVIHETLVDLLMIQKKIHRGVFAVMDGTFAGDGPGPRCMTPYVKNVILASADQVAIDAVAAKMMGFDPLKDCKYIRLAHDLGLGCGNVEEIEIVGDKSAAQENWHFVGPFKEMTFASRMQHKIYWGRLKKPIEWSLKTWLAPWAYIASVLYHDMYWYPRKSKKMMEACLQSDWGKLFQNWGQVPETDEGFPEVGVASPEYVQKTADLLKRSTRVLLTCIREAPEISAFKKHPAGAKR